MKKLLAVIAISLSACKPPAAEVNIVALDLLPTSVKIDLGGGSCSGVYIGDGFFLTASHCTVGGSVYKIDGEAAELMWENRKYDISLLRLPQKAARKATPLVCRKAIPGEDIYAVTAPAGFDAIQSYGKVAGDKRAAVHWAEVLPLNLMGAHGSSGGPVFDRNGNLLGIVVGGFNPWGNFLWAVPVSTICQLMARA